jgi:peptidylprolyl isomerase
VLAFVACGDASSSDETEGSGAAETTRKLVEPVVKPPSGPPPKALVIRDIKEGAGAAAIPGDELSVHYVGVDRTGKEVYSSWTFRDGEALDFELGSGEYFRGWEEGLEGMKAEGRRELQIPKRLAQDRLKPLFYIVDLLEIK